METCTINTVAFDCIFPSALPDLVARFEGRRQGPVGYITSSWEDALADWPEERSVLVDDRWSEPSERLGRRRVTRDHLASLLTSTNPDEPLQLRQAFVMVMVWGSGTSNTRSLRNTPAALAAVRCADQLRQAAELCRSSDLVRAYTRFALPGVRRSFFTKWFAFAGVEPGRSWQPLILDDRVLATLNHTFGVTLKDVAGERRWSHRYAAYVHCMHNWSAELQVRGVSCTAERLEWIMFRHGGGPL
ncbi:hypothetical protein [Micromonospora sp. NPDC005087]|uniref:8-oxoguanine DNA glycosylase OGG fold protein n=1 Tax=Micromonospora sp. NPDC005087 TaxID=3364225 RepID=UPI00368DE284